MRPPLGSGRATTTLETHVFVIQTPNHLPPAGTGTGEHALSLRGSGRRARGSHYPQSLHARHCTSRSDECGGGTAAYTFRVQRRQTAGNTSGPGTKAGVDALIL